MNINNEIKTTTSHYCGDLAEVEPVLIPYYDFNGVLSQEQIWAEMIAPDKYLIKSIPVYATNIAFGDLLQVERLSDGLLYFDDLLETSENSTIRIVFFNFVEENVNRILNGIQELGCEWVGFEGGSYYSINVDKNIQYSKIKSYLDQNSQIIDYAESCISDKHIKDLTPPIS